MNLKVKFLISFILFLIFFLFFQGTKKVLDNEAMYVKEMQKRMDLEKLQKIVDSTTAQGVIVYDSLNDNVLASKNVDKTYSLASLTKIITAVIVYEKDTSLLDEIRDMIKTSNNQEAIKLGYTFGLTENDQALYMNNFTKKIGNFNFRNPTGLDVFNPNDSNDILPGGEADLFSLINFLKKYYFKYPEIFDQSIISKNNTNIITDKISFLTGSKTGFTNLSGGNLFVSVQKGLNRQIFIIVLSSTEKNRFVDVQNIGDFLLQSSI